MKRELPLGACLKASAAFVPQAYRRAWGALLLGSLPFAVTLVRPVVDHANSHPGQAALFLAIGLAALTITGLVRDGALYRLGVLDGEGATGRRGLGPAGLQFGPVELRLLAGGLLVSLFLLLIFIAGFVVSLFVAAAAGLGEVDWSSVRTVDQLVGLAEPWKLGLVAAAPTGLCLILLGLGVKLSLYAAATVGRGRVVSIDALGLAEGNGLKLLIGLVIVYAPTLAVVLARPWLDSAGLMIAPVAELAVAGLLQPPLTVGFLSAAYKALEYVNTQDIGGEVHG